MEESEREKDGGRGSEMKEVRCVLYIHATGEQQV